jgi:hypothetical protein
MADAPTLTAAARGRGKQVGRRLPRYSPGPWHLSPGRSSSAMRSLRIYSRHVKAYRPGVVGPPPDQAPDAPEPPPGAPAPDVVPLPPEPPRVVDAVETDDGAGIVLLPFAASE